MLHEKSSRNCHFFCCVVCGVLMFCPIVTPLGKVMFGSRLFAVIALAKSAYWKMNSFSFAPPSTQLWLQLIELNVLPLTPQLSGGDSGAGAVRLAVGVAAVANRQVLRGVQVRRALDVSRFSR